MRTLWKNAMRATKLGYLALLVAALVLSQGCTNSQRSKDSRESNEPLRLVSEDFPGELYDVPLENWPQSHDTFTESLIGGASTQQVRKRYGHARLHANPDPPDSPLVGHFYCANENEPLRRWLNVWQDPDTDKIVDVYWSAYPGWPPSSKEHQPITSE
jgi:hypothetical protein